jgi:hypothetical protein
MKNWESKSADTDGLVEGGPDCDFTIGISSILYRAQFWEIFNEY